jgi:hypothetical protein
MSAAAGAATCPHAINHDANEHESHTHKDHQMRGELRTGRPSVVVIESRVEVGNQIGRDSEGNDRQSDLRSNRQLMGGPEYTSDGCNSWHWLSVQVGRWFPMGAS